MGIVLGWGLPGIWAGTLLDNGFVGYSYVTVTNVIWTLKG